MGTTYHTTSYMKVRENARYSAKGVEEKPPCSPLRGLMQTLSVKNKSHRYLTKPVALAVIAYETGGSARSRNTVKARCFCGMDARVCYEKALLEPDDFPTSPLIKDVQRPIFSATIYI